MGILHRFPITAVGVLAAILNIPMSAAAQTEVASCVLEAIWTAPESKTVGEIRAECRSRETADADRTAMGDQAVPVYERSVIEERFEAEAESERRPFMITPHNPNFILATYFDDPNQAPFEQVTGISQPVEDTEMKFQVSIKAPIWQDMFGTNIDTYFAYTAQSYWQMFNDDLSAPFRETNYEPELFIRSFADYDFLGMTIAGWSLGFNHQSNGRSDPLSRSWNRILGRAALQITDDLALLARAWYRLPEDDKDDDNPHMHRYYGYGDLRAIWTPNRNTFTALVRPGTEKTSFELTWSYPISRVFRIYAQYYKGYGESLIDYDYKNERFGIGIALNDYLMRQ